MNRRTLPPHPLTAAEASKLLDVCGGGRVGTRNRALVALGYRAGLRAGEVCGLMRNDLRRLDPSSDHLVVRVEKPKGYRQGSQPREVGLDAKATLILEDWLSLRGLRPGPLFDTSTGQALKTSYLRRLMPLLAERAGVTRRVHYHCLRHTFARQLYDEGVGLVEIMQALGHKRLNTTQQYLEHIGATRAVAVTASRTW